MYMFIRKYTKVRSVVEAARRTKSGIGQILRESHGVEQADRVARLQRLYSVLLQA
jgi:hypothetical protein